MGPNLLQNALPQGGRFLAEYPVNWENHIEGHIEHYWLSHKAPLCSFKSAKEMSDFVCPLCDIY